MEKSVIIIYNFHTFGYFLVNLLEPNKTIIKVKLINQKVAVKIYRNSPFKPRAAY